MQQIFLFFIMLIAASEAFLNGSHISTSNKKKISGFVPNARIFKSVKVGDMDFPGKIDSQPGIISPRDGSTFLSLSTRHKRFSNNDTSGLKELDNVSFLRSRNYLNKKAQFSSRRLRSMRRKRKMASLLPATKIINVYSHPGSENSSVSSVISVFNSPVDSNKFYGKSLYSEGRNKVVKKKYNKDLRYLPFSSKQLLKHSNFRIKRQELMESRNVEKPQREAETVNVSQANFTQDVEEKKLDKNDSLNDSYSHDLRPELAIKLLNDTPSNQQKYSELNSQPVSSSFLPSMTDDTDYYDPILDFPPSSMYVPRINFLAPDDRKIYEDANSEDDENDVRIFRIPENKDEVEKKKNKKKKEKTSEESSDLDKLKHVLDDVESAIKKEKGSSKFMMKKKGGKGGGRPENSEDFIRAKIDVVVPLLLQISQELSQRSAQLQRASSEKKLNFSDQDGEGRGIKESKKKFFDCSLDGIWFSDIMGLEINVSTQHNLMLKVTLKSFKKDAIIDNNWSMHGLTLSKTEGPFILAAICPGKRKIASFMDNHDSLMEFGYGQATINYLPLSESNTYTLVYCSGQCWMFEREEYVYGSWTIYSKVQRITDLLTTVETKLDVLTRRKRHR